MNKEINMNKFIVTIFLVLFASTIYSQTQSELNKKAGTSSIKSEQEMETVLEKITLLYNDEKDFLKKLHTSQEAWLKFRKAQLDALYPAKDKQEAYGSSYAMAYAYAKEELNKQRIKQLMLWVNGIEEGVIGAGSVKLKSQLKK